MSPRHPRPADLPEALPLFPLPGALLLPRGQLPLHIFEPRYLAMVEDCLKSPLRLIGMICPLGDTPGAEPPPDVPRLSSVGCAGRITRFTELDDGRLMITLSGIARFALGEELGGFTPYRRARADWSPFLRDLGPAETDPDLDRASFVPLLSRYLSGQGLSLDAEALAGAADEDLVNAVAAICPFTPEEKQALLEAPTLPTRREMLVTLLEYALRGGGAPDEVLQ